MVVCGSQTLEQTLHRGRSRSMHGQKTYNTRDSLVVTDPTTDLALTNLIKGERTGSHVLSRIWSYVVVRSRNFVDIRRLWHKAHRRQGSRVRVGLASATFTSREFEDFLPFGILKLFNKMSPQRESFVFLPIFSRFLFSLNCKVVAQANPDSRARHNCATPQLTPGCAA